jgi:hypothetical protein
MDLSAIKTSVVHNAVILNVMATTIIYGSLMHCVRGHLLGYRLEEKAAGKNVDVEGQARFKKEANKQAHRCICLKKYWGQLNNWLASVLVRDYVTPKEGELNLI